MDNARVNMKNALEKAIETIVRVSEPDTIILFGSYAKGKQKKGSDYDLLVLKKGLRKPRNLAQKIYLNFKDIGAPVDIIVASLSKFEKLKSDPYLIYGEASRHGKIVYEKK